MYIHMLYAILGGLNPSIWSKSRTPQILGPLQIWGLDPK